MHKREKRLNELLEEYGCATECHITLSDPPERYALMESDEGAADNGGPWWNLGDDAALLLHHSYSQEYPSDWPAELLFDLDTGKQVMWELKIVLTQSPS